MIFTFSNNLISQMESLIYVLFDYSYLTCLINTT